MRYSTITYEVTGAVAIISLNRPDVRNCISLTMTTELDAAFTAACRDHAVRVMVLRAVGPNFSSGHDLGSAAHLLELKDRDYPRGPLGDVEKWSEMDTEMCLRWRQLPKPLIVGVKGYCIYHATALVAVADIAIAAPDLMYMPSLIEFSSLPFETGLSLKRCKEILLTQRFVHAAEAAELGIVNHVIGPAADLDAELMRYAAQIAKGDPMHLRQMKAMANGAQDAAGLPAFARAGLSHWATWRWQWESNAKAMAMAKTTDPGGSAKRLAPVKDAESGDARRISEEASLRAKL